MPLTSFPDNPFDFFNDWFEEAASQEINDPNAMSLATVNAHGQPSVRMVLLKGQPTKGFTFFTNLESRKAQDIKNNPHVGLCFHWKSLQRQIRIEGVAQEVDSAEADTYFASRPVGFQLSAWASLQSRPLKNRDTLEARMADFAMKFGDSPIPRPSFWLGFRVIPSAIEFWQDRPFRLHDRILYTKIEPESDGWSVSRLYP